MKLAGSNIAWPNGVAADELAAEILVRHGATGVELAPGKCWPDPIAASKTEALAVRDWWEGRGLQIVAFQALLFGRPDLVLFGEPAARQALAAHLDRLSQLAAWVGAKTLVFGSPKNRLRGNRSLDDVLPTAVEFFRQAGDCAASHGVVIGIEANPAEYGGDFVTHLHYAVALVKLVASPGFGLHLDTGGMTLTGEDLSVLDDVAPIHFHISDPNLTAIGEGYEERHRLYARQLKLCQYDGWRSIEMRQLASDWPSSLERAIQFSQAVYGSE